MVGTSITSKAGFPRVPPVVKIQRNTMECGEFYKEESTECASENTGVVPNPVSFADPHRITRPNQICERGSGMRRKEKYAKG